MTTQISVSITDGSRITKKDLARAETAALAVLASFDFGGQTMKIDPSEACAAFVRHMSDEDYLRSPRDTVLIAAWEAAQSAADLALTQGWSNPDGAHCEIAA